MFEGILGTRNSVAKLIIQSTNIGIRRLYWDQVIALESGDCMDAGSIFGNFRSKYRDFSNYVRDTFLKASCNVKLA